LVFAMEFILPRNGSGAGLFIDRQVES
jgi:hypothetical protein